MPKPTPPIERVDTGIRILFSILLMLITEVVQIILGFVTVFSLTFALVTQQPPSEQVRRFANRTLSYLYQIFRYLTYNAAALPFPFADFPAELEAVASGQAETPERDSPPAETPRPPDTQSSDNTPEREHRLL
jgi:hypothetical protein